VILVFHISCWDDKCVPPSPDLFSWDGVLQTFFCSGWLKPGILPVSAFSIT
jgi:hypothetical protein